MFVTITESFILKLVIYPFYFVMTNSKGSFGDRIANKVAFCVLNDSIALKIAYYFHSN